MTQILRVVFFWVTLIVYSLIEEAELRVTGGLTISDETGTENRTL